MKFLKQNIKPISINGVNIYPFKSFEHILKYSINKNKILIAINSRKIINNDIELKRLINSNIGYIDGFGAQLAIRRKKNIKLPKLPGCEMWLEILKKHESDKSFYFIGSTDKVIYQTLKKLKYNFPKLNIVGYRNGFLKDKSEIKSLVCDFLIKKPDVIFVAMGSPKQEYFMSKLQGSFSALYVGLGGSFDVYIGNVKRAPKWWVENNLEWAYRYLQQPSRIKERALQLIKFIVFLYFKKI